MATEWKEKIVYDTGKWYVIERRMGILRWWFIIDKEETIMIPMKTEPYARRACELLAKGSTI